MRLLTALEGIPLSIARLWYKVRLWFATLIGQRAKNHAVDCLLQLLPAAERGWGVRWELELFFQDMPDSIATRCVGLLEDVPERERTEALALWQRFSPDLTDAGLRKEVALRFLLSLPREGRRDPHFLEGLKLLVEEVGTSLFSSYQLIATLPEEGRATAVRLGTNLVREVGDPEWLQPYLEEYPLVAPEDREAYARYFLEKIGEEGVEPPFFLQIIHEHPELGGNAYAFLLRSLEEIVHPEEARPLAGLLLGGQEAFGLADEDPLIQSAHRVRILTDPGELDLPANPYRVYRKLRQWAEVPLSAPTEMVARTFVQWDVQGLRERAKPARYLRTDLAEGVQIGESNIFQVTFERVQGELEEEQVESIQNFLGNAMIQALLSPKGEEVSAYSYQLYQVGAALVAASGEEKKAMLLAVAASIQFCAGGVREGIALYFNNLPEEYRQITGQASVGDTTEKVDSFLANHLHKLMTDQFVDLRLLRRFGQSSQEHHGTLFLKNLLFRQVGYEGHQLQFDLHTGVLSERLVGLVEDTVSLRCAAYTYLQFLQISSLVESVKEEINSDLEREHGDQRIGLTALAFYLSGGASESTQPLFSQGHVVDRSEEQDFTGPFALTDLGVLSLLKRARLIKVD